MEEKNKQDETGVLLDVPETTESGSDSYPDEPVNDDKAVDGNEDELENPKSKSVVNPVVDEDILDKIEKDDEGDSVNDNLHLSRNDTASGNEGISDIEIIEDNEDEPRRNETSATGPVHLEKSSSTPSSKSQDSSSNVISRATQPTNLGDGILALEIPDDAFLIEAPSSIVPYVFEQSGGKSLKDAIKDLEVTIRRTRDLKLEKGEELNDTDDIIEIKKMKSDNYFDGPVGKLLMNVGMNLVQEYVQVDLLKMQTRKAEEERNKSLTRTISMQTQQSILSLKKNIEESKENNEAFRHETKKCTFCNFKTESNLVMSAHLETPHMRNYSYRCNFCDYTTIAPHEILFHVETEHFVNPRLERAPEYHQCPNCSFEDNSKAKLTRHLIGCSKRFKIEKNLEPPLDWDTPAKLPKLEKTRLLPQSTMNSASMGGAQQRNAAPAPTCISIAPKFIPGGKMSILRQTPESKPVPGLIKLIAVQKCQSASASQSLLCKPSTQPSISITPLPRQAGSNSASATTSNKPKQAQGEAGKTSFVICEICDGYIKDLDQLKNHMQWIHKVEIRPSMIYLKPPLACQKCPFRFFTDKGLERHFLGSHGLVTSSMQEAANKGQDSGRCPLCGKVYQWKLLTHVAKDHNVTLLPAQLSYKCTICSATFTMYKLFESHVYSAHSMAAMKNVIRRPVPPKNNDMTSRAAQMQVSSIPMSASVSSQNSFKPMKINDEITIIPQPLANSNPSLRNKGSITITPRGSTSRRSCFISKNDDDEIQIIEIDEAPSKPSTYGRNRNPKENGDFKGRLPISDSTLQIRKRNVEISGCGTDSDKNSSDESFSRGSAHKRLRSSYITMH